MHQTGVNLGTSPPPRADKLPSFIDIYTTADGNGTSSTSSSHALGFEEAWRQARTHSQGMRLRDIPKVDLHCHLNGSINPPLVEHMAGLQRRARESNCGESVVTEMRSESPTGGTLGHTDGILKQFRNSAERMKYCFSVFDNIYTIMTNLAFTRMAVQDLLVHSAAENVFVLEIRTSLRDGLYQTLRAAECKLESECITKKMYIEAIISTVEHLVNGGVVDFETGELVPIDAPLTTIWWKYFGNLYGSLLSITTEVSSMEREEMVVELWRNIRNHLTRRMHIRLLVSINRGHSVEAAMEAVLLAKEVQREQLDRFFFALLHPSSAAWGNDYKEREAQLRSRIRHVCWLSGIDFAGNCYKNTFTDFLPAITLARQETKSHGNRDTSGGVGLPYPSLGITLHAGEKEDAAELTAMIAFAPERWGHLVFTNPDNLSLVIARHDAIELCITSNTLTGGYADVGDHHVGDLIQKQHEEVERAQTGGEVKDPIGLIELLTNAHDAGVAMRYREARRYARWSKQTIASAAWPVKGVGPRIPNVSFHTDDRGVFGTCVTGELQMLLQHASLGGGSTETELQVRAMWTLQRLSLPHVFEIPLEVVYYYYCTCSGGHRHALGEDNANSVSEKSNDKSDKMSGASENCRALVAVMDGNVRAELSRIELSWLLKDFDDFWLCE